MIHKRIITKLFTNQNIWGKYVCYTHNKEKKEHTIMVTVVLSGYKYYGNYDHYDKMVIFCVRQFKNLTHIGVS